MNLSIFNILSAFNGIYLLGLLFIYLFISLLAVSVLHNKKHLLYPRHVAKSCITAMSCSSCIGLVLHTHITMFTAQYTLYSSGCSHTPKAQAKTDILSAKRAN